MKASTKTIWKVLKIIGGIIWVVYTAACTIVNYELSKDWYRERSENRFGKYILEEIDEWLCNEELDNYITVCGCKGAIAKWKEKVSED